MPAKKVISKEKILATCIGIVREEGVEGVNTLNVAKKLGCSTQPIYLSFKNIDDLREHVREEAVKVFFDYIERELAAEKYPRYKAFGMAYIRFAREEKQLFRLIYFRDRKGDIRPDDASWERAVQEIIASLGVTRAQAERFQLEMWIFSYGIASMAVTDYLEFDEETVSGLVSDVYFGLKGILKEKKA